MLFSVLHNFVFIKSKKTASTSIECALETLITGEIGQHRRDAAFLDDGSIIGSRRTNAKKKKNMVEDQSKPFPLNHIGASDIKILIGENAFNKSTIISSIRCPYDQRISFFHFSKFCSIPDKSFPAYSAKRTADF